MNIMVQALAFVLILLTNVSQQFLSVASTDITHKTKSSLGSSVIPKGIKVFWGQKVWELLVQAMHVSHPSARKGAEVDRLKSRWVSEMWGRDYWLFAYEALLWLAREVRLSLLLAKQAWESAAAITNGTHLTTGSQPRDESPGYQEERLKKPHPEWYCFITSAQRPSSAS